MNWYKMEETAVEAELKVDPKQGLTGPEARRRLEEHGPNELIDKGLKSPWSILWEQMTAVMVIILIVTAGLSALLGDFKDMIAILAIVVLYVILGFSQEYRAEKAMAALKRLAVPNVRVRREGKIIELSARELVPGDIILLEAGNLVPADARLLEAINLRIQESALTGESEPVDKSVVSLGEKDLAIADRINTIYMGTVVTYGRSTAIVVETGMNTELGNIARMIQTTERETTPLQRKLDQLGKTLAIGAIGISVFIFLLGLLRGEEIKLMVLTAISIAVAAVPEGLPAVVTIALAIGAQRMLKRQSLVRKLTAVETLGSVTVICSDKTGTLTENRMTVTAIDAANHRLDLTEYFKNKHPSTATSMDQDSLVFTRPEIGLLLTIGSLCNDAILKHEEETGSYTALGDPTEGSLTIAAANFGLEKNRLDQLFPRIGEIAFDSDRKRMSTIHQQPPQSMLKYNTEWMNDDGIDPQDRLVFTKGSVDGLLEVCNRIYHDRKVSPITPEMVDRINRSNLEFAQKGMRILATAYKPIREMPMELTPETIEQDLIFVGLFAIIDPPREEVKLAVQTCRQAGIRPVMITGDHPLTALHIATQLGIADNDQVLTGKKLDQMSMDEFSRMVENVSVFARVSPEHKLKIIQALQAKGHIVSMTGDGVNDAPALKKADIGVAMGITGTDVSKEAADMVLRDDNFSTIVAAVEEGRVIFDNIRKFIQYSIAGNIGKILAVLIMPFLGMPMPLLPLQLLWLNLLTDGLLGLGIGMEPAEQNTMQRPPYPPHRPIFDAPMLRQVIIMGLAIGLIAILAGYLSWLNRIENWQTILFTTLAVAQMFQALGVRSYRDSIFKIGLMSNRTMAAMVASAFILQLGAIYLPFFQSFFTTRGLTLPQLLLTIGSGSLILALTELQKLFRKH